jgi:uncharacterized lipoprotein YehR (DUF1307 family)
MSKPQFRVYQYQYDCNITEVKKYPYKGEWVVQRRDDDIWRNVSSGYANKSEAEQVMKKLAKEKSEIPLDSV